LTVPLMMSVVAPTCARARVGSATLGTRRASADRTWTSRRRISEAKVGIELLLLNTVMALGALRADGRRNAGRTCGWMSRASDVQIVNRLQCSKTSTMLSVSSRQYWRSSAPHLARDAGSELDAPYIIS